MTRWARQGQAVLRRTAEPGEEYRARLEVAGYPYAATARREVSADRDVIVLVLYAALRDPPTPKGEPA